MTALSGPVEAVALDAMGVIYAVADDLRDLLIPYLREKGCAVPDDAIVGAFRSCYRDGAPARSIWELAGCDWADGALERDFLARYRLNEGIVAFLEAMQSRSIPVFGLSNDIGEWARKRLGSLRLEGLFAGWVFSSEVRAHKPDPAIYEHLLRMLPCEAGACVFVDDRVPNLEAARSAGLQGVWFSSSTHEDFASVPDFETLTELVRGAP